MTPNNVFLNRLIGRTGERDDRHDMENDCHLVSWSDCLQSRQVLTGNVPILINTPTNRYVVVV